MVVQVPPVSPSGLTQSPLTPTSVFLQWNSLSTLSDIGYSPITDYSIYWDAGQGGIFYQLLSSTSNFNNATITGLTSG